MRTHRAVMRRRVPLRSNPVGPGSGGLGQYNMSSNSYIAGFRFELDNQINIDRFYFQINGEGATCAVGRTGYGNGNGGIWFGRVVDCNQTTGLPILANILGSESINACTRHNDVITEYGLSGVHQIHYVGFSSITLNSGKLYAFLLSNTDASPGTGGGASSGNHMSINCNWGLVSQAGPNAANTLDSTATGAMYGLGPRGTTMWSADSGSTWRFGDQIGWYGNGDGNLKWWPTGYRITGGNEVPIGWPFRSWPSDATGGGTVTYNSIPKAVTITGAGGMNDGGGSVGVITVTNMTTSASSTTASLGSGKVSGNLGTPITASAGDNIRIATSGRIGNGAVDGGPGVVYGLGTRAPWTYTINVGSNMPLLFLIPHPFF